MLKNLISSKKQILKSTAPRVYRIRHEEATSFLHRVWASMFLFKGHLLQCLPKYDNLWTHW